MPLVYQQNINEDTGLVLWEIMEEESFFAEQLKVLPVIRHPHKRVQHLAGRYLLTWLVNKFPVNHIRIAETRRPFLENGEYHFSISHCGNYAAALVSKTWGVGVDIEGISIKAANLKDKFLTQAEQQLLTAAMNEGTLAYTSGWSIKEALFKWHGLGGVNFREQLNILSMEYNMETRYYSGQARVSKGLDLLLKFEGRVIAGQCITYVVSRD